MQAEKNNSDGDEPIEVVPYDPRWPERFESERRALEGAIGGWATGGIHHVGSTAVPGLDAKPVVDILVGVESLDAARACFEPLSRLGYLHAPTCRRRCTGSASPIRVGELTICTWSQPAPSASATSWRFATPCARAPSWPSHTP